MEYNLLIDKIFNLGKERIDEMEVFISESKNIDVEIFQGEVDKYTIAQSRGLSLRGIVDGKMGYSYTEKVDESSIDYLLDGVLNSAKSIESEDKVFLYDGMGKYNEIEKQSNDFNNISMEEKIEFLKSVEKKVLEIDSRVISVQGLGYSEMESSSFIRNTKNVSLEDGSKKGIVYLSIMAKEGEDVKTGMSYRIFNNFSELDGDEIASEAARDALEKLGASSIRTGKYPVIIENTTFASLLSAMSSIFSAENIDKGLSMLKDKIGESIAVEGFNLIDDPYLEEGFNKRTFDDEGVPTKKNHIIENGVLKSYFHNLKTANKYNQEPTGNGQRSYKGSVFIAPYNLYVEKGDRTLEEMVSSIDEGILINDLQGLHSGLDSISGDFSLSASGMSIVDGKITRPIELITIAGNFFDLIKDIEEIASDFKVGLSQIGSASIKIKSISVAGE